MICQQNDDEINDTTENFLETFYNKEVRSHGEQLKVFDEGIWWIFPRVDNNGRPAFIIFLSIFISPPGTKHSSRES